MPLAAVGTKRKSMLCPLPLAQTQGGTRRPENPGRLPLSDIPRDHDGFKIDPPPRDPVIRPREHLKPPLSSPLPFQRPQDTRSPGRSKPCPGQAARPSDSRPRGGQPFRPPDADPDLASPSGCVACETPPWIWIWCGQATRSHHPADGDCSLQLMPKPKRSLRKDTYRVKGG